MLSTSKSHYQQTTKHVKCEKMLDYEVAISTNYHPKKYIGLCEMTFKKQFSGHKSSFLILKDTNTVLLYLQKLGESKN